MIHLFAPQLCVFMCVLFTTAKAHLSGARNSHIACSDK